MEDSTAHSADATGVPQLALLGGFQLRFNGRMIRLPVSGQRLLALLALKAQHLPRSYIAGLLWPDRSEEHARASLRTTLWRVRSRLPLIDSVERTLCLAPAVVVDVHQVECVASAVLNAPSDQIPEPKPLLNAGELLPGFYDEWVLMERERLHQLQLHALEALCRRHTSMGRHDNAVAAGVAAVAADPLRESAQTALITAYLAEGNPSEAIRQYERYRQMLREELDLEPSPSLRNELRAFLTIQRPDRAGRPDGRGRAGLRLHPAKTKIVSRSDIELPGI